MILTTPLFSELKRVFPDCNLFVLASAGNHAIPDNLNCVDYIYIYDKKTVSTVKLLLSLRRKSFDYWIDPKDEYSSTSVILEKFCKPKISLGFNVRKKVFDVNLKDFVIGKHSVDINLSPVNYLSEYNEYKTVLPHVDIPDKDSNKIAERCTIVKEKYVLLNLSAGVSTRYLKTEKWIKLADNIEADMNVVLTGQEKDYDSINSVIKSVKRKNIFFIETNTIFELAELIRKSAMLVTPDTSAVHLASCFNIPVVVMYHRVQWNIIKFGPLSDKQRIVVSDDENSFDSISPDDLIQEVNGLLF